MADKTTEKSQYSRAHLEGFLDYIKSEGFVVTINHYIQLDVLIKDLENSGKEIAELKYILSPIFSNSSEEQELFYDLFDRYFVSQIVDGRTKKTESGESASDNEYLKLLKKTRKKRRRVVIGILFGIFAITFFYVYYSKKTGPDPELTYEERETVNSNLEAASTYWDTYDYETQDLLNQAYEYATVYEDYESCYDIIMQLSGRDGTLDIYLDRCLTVLDPKYGDPDKFRPSDEQKWEFRDIVYQAEMIAEDYCRDSDHIFDLLMDATNAYDRNDVDLALAKLEEAKFECTEAESQIDIAREHILASRQSNSSITSGPVLYAALILLFAFIAYEYYLRYNKKLIARTEFGKKPPYFWEFKIGEPANIHWDENIRLVAQGLRKREPSDETEFDIEGTIDKTIKKGGLTELAFVHKSRPSEYLILIDRESLENHQSSLFSFLVDEFSNNDIYVEKFFYMNDFSAFWSETDDSTIYTLDDLYRLFPKHRLIIFGKAHELIDRRKRGLRSTALQLERWQKRAILTSKPGPDWNFQEVLLSESFTVLPSTTAGLLQLTDHYEELKPNHLSLWKKDFEQEIIDIPQNTEIGINFLRFELGEEVFEWLCCCAVFPQLYWDLTMHLGTELFDEKRLVSQENIGKLARISWFKSGFISDDYRGKLVQELPPERVEEVRKTIVDEMKKHPPTLGTYAHDQYRLNLLLNEALIESLPAKRRLELEKEIHQLQNELDEDFYTEVEAIPSKRKNVLDFVLPNELRNRLKGTSLKKTFARFGIFLLLLTAVSSCVIGGQILFKGGGDWGTMLVLLVLSSLLGVIYWRSRRTESPHGAAETAFHWVLSFGFYYILCLLLLPILQDDILFSDQSTSQGLRYMLLPLTFASVLTVLLILGSRHKEKDPRAIALYWLVFSAILFFGIFMILAGQGIVDKVWLKKIDPFEEVVADREVLASAFLTFVASSLFVIYRFWKAKPKNSTEFAIYFLGGVILAYPAVKVLPFEMSGWLLSGFALLFSIGIIIYSARKSSVSIARQFSKSYVSLYWLGTMWVMLLSNDNILLIPKTFLAGFVILTGLGLMFLKWFQQKKFDYESTIYLPFAYFTAVVLLNNFLFDISDRTTLIVSIVLMLSYWGGVIVVLRSRKNEITFIELFIFWGVSTLVTLIYNSLFTTIGSTIIPSIIILGSFVGLLIFKGRAINRAKNPKPKVNFEEATAKK